MLSLPNLARPHSTGTSASLGSSFFVLQDLIASLETSTSSRSSNPSTLIAEASSSAYSHTRQPTFDTVKGIGLESFEPIRQIGKGGHGTVFLVKHKTTSSTFALKVVQKMRIRPKSLHRIFQEQEIMKRLVGNPWFLSLEASFQDTENFFFVTVSNYPLYYSFGIITMFRQRYYYRGDLLSMIWDHGRLKPSLARQYAAEIVRHFLAC